jgi:threonine/homoserine/homoserine lactone efflux protein
MIDPVLFLTFVPVAVALILTPGADMMFCFAQGMTGGARAATAASAGVSLGVMVHVLLAGLGFGALVTAFPWVFGAIRWIGAGYLVWLAWKTFRTPLVVAEVPSARMTRAFRDGLIVNLSNPKVILFMLALLPQFVDPARPVLPQFLAYGAVIAAGAFVLNALVGVFSGGLGRRFLRNPRTERGMRLATGSIFAALAARIGWEAVRA